MMQQVQDLPAAGRLSSQVRIKVDEAGTVLDIEIRSVIAARGPGRNKSHPKKHKISASISGFVGTVTDDDSVVRAENDVAKMSPLSQVRNIA